MVKLLKVNTSPFSGCTDQNALNYNEFATYDDGSCNYPVCQILDIPLGWFLFSTHIIPQIDLLQYLSNDDSYRMSATEVTENNVSHYAKVAATDNNMTVVIEDAAWDILPTEGSEIAAFDKDGNMVGSAIYSSPVTVVTVWGDDATTTSKDGMLVSESVSFKVWNTNEVSDFTVAKWIEGSSSYQVDGISVASTIETNNVMTELNASERVLVKVINVLGQEVNLDDQPFKGTVLFNVYDSTA